jgi:hypothetical protein
MVKPTSTSSNMVACPAIASTRQLTTILAADVTGTRLTGADEEGTLAVLKTPAPLSLLCSELAKHALSLALAACFASGLGRHHRYDVNDLCLCSRRYETRLSTGQ